MLCWSPAVRLVCFAVAAVVAISGRVPAGPQEALAVSVGIGGTWKLGQPCPVRVTIPASLIGEAKGLEIDSIDGDGVQVTYRKLIAAGPIGDANNAADHDVWHRIQIGRSLKTLSVRLTGDAGVLAQRDVMLGDESVPLASSQPLVVAVGSSMGVEALSLKSANDSSSTLSTVVIGDANQLPPDLIDYAACDLLLISTRHVELLQSIDPDQWSAIDGWIRTGGGCIIALGTSAQDLASVPALLDLLPGKVMDQGLVTNPGGLESLVGSASEDPLKPFPVTLLELDDGEVKLTLTDSLSRRLPWWVVHAHGHGTIRIVASDMDAPALANWGDRRVLWDRLIEPYFSKSMMDNAGASEETLAGSSSYLGYNDLVGQLRATLDVFSTVRQVTFGQIAAVLIAIVVLVGPVDYFVSVKWLKRPSTSWVFAGIVLVGTSIGLTSFYYSIRPDRVLVNSAHIVDVDVESGRVEGRIWSHVYSGNARQVDIDMVGPSGASVAVDWQGLPGPGLGGLTSQLTTDRGMPPYAIATMSPSTSSLASESFLGTKVLGVAIPSSGTKCLNGRWATTLEAGSLGTVANSQLQELAGVDQLQGVFTNPLNVELRDAVLFYHDWYYILNSRIAPGEQILISSEQIPKDLPRRLKRQRNVDGNVRISRWDSADRGELDRLLELMMFYKAASGVNYASLTHRYQPQVDHSNLLELDKAVLLGRTDIAPAAVKVSGVEGSTDQTDLVSEGGMERVWYRIIFPVESRRK